MPYQAYRPQHIDMKAAQDLKEIEIPNSCRKRFSYVRARLKTRKFLPENMRKANTERALNYAMFQATRLARVLASNSTENPSGEPFLIQPHPH